MGETPPPPPPKPHGFYYNILGISKSASLSEIRKAYKSLIRKWHPDRHANKPEAEAKYRSINEAYRVLSGRKRGDNIAYDDEPKTPIKLPNPPKDDDELVISNPTLISRMGNMASPESPRKLAEFYASFLNGSFTPSSTPGVPVGIPSLLSRNATRKTISTPIIFSQSTTRRKPPPIEKSLECTLEELCFGSVKNVKITRDVLSDLGLIFQEEETLKIKVHPGWRKGTKLTFQGKGDEKPGWLPADIIFVVEEKEHPLYTQQADDLELAVEIPLIQALTGCTIDVPLLGGGHTNLSFVDDIIYPDYETTVSGQGMVVSKDGEVRRGDLRLKFAVGFPMDLSDEQRSDVVHILNEGC